MLSNKTEPKISTTVKTVDAPKPNKTLADVDCYNKERRVRDTEQQEERFQRILRFREMILNHEGFTNVSIISGPKSLYTNLYKMQPKRFISRPHFLTCMRLSGVNITKPKNNESVNKLYSSFDVFDREEMDWRQFIILLWVTLNPELSCGDYLSWAFCLLTSNDLFEKDTSSLLRLGVAKETFNSMVTKHNMTQVYELCDDTWLSLAINDPEATTFINKINDGSSKMDDAKISLNQFKQILSHRCFGNIFNFKPMKSLINTCRFGHVCSFEKRFIAQGLLDYIASQRRIRYTNNKASEFRISFKQTTSFRKLVLNRRNQRHGKGVMISIIRHLLGRIYSFSFEKIRAAAVQEIASIDIQRIIRGFLSKREARIEYILIYSATRIQSFYRARLAMIDVASIVWVREWASTEIQRLARGSIGRKKATNKLIRFVTEERRKLDEDRRIWEISRQHRGATKIQALCRRRLAHKKADLMREQKKREQKIEKELLNTLLRYKRERKTYEMQLQEQYREKRLKWIDDKSTKTRNKRDRRKTFALERKLANVKKIQLEEQKMRYDEKCERKRTKEWQIENITTKCEEYKKFCMRCITNPRTSEEKELGAELKKKIKARTKNVLKRADDRCILMEKLEAKRIAQREILFIAGEEEKQREREKMELEMVGDEERKHIERCDTMTKMHEQKAIDRIEAGKILHRAYNIWRSKKTLCDKCIHNYEKVYHEESHSFFYRNKRSGEVAWDKPKALGRFDIEISDEWILLRDQQQFPYYYNPYSMEMSWTAPKGTLLCSENIKYEWWAFYPQPVGRCIHFANRKSKSGRLFCNKCWDNRFDHAGDEDFTEVRGSVPYPVP